MCLLIPSLEGNTRNSVGMGSLLSQSDLFLIEPDKFAKRHFHGFLFIISFEIFRLNSIALRTAKLYGVLAVLSAVGLKNTKQMKS